MQVFRGLFFVERKFIFWGVRIYFLGSANLFFESANQADEGKECRVCARFVGTAPFDIKRECEKNYANYTLNHTFC